MNKIGTLSIIFSSVLVGCGGEDSSNNSGEESSSVVSTMTMTVKASNYFTGDSIEGASIVIVEGSDEQITSYSGVTDSNGEVSLDVNSDVTRFIVSGDAQSFGEYSKVIVNGDQNIELFLQPVNAELTFSPDQDSDLEVSGIDIVSLPANSLVDSDGNIPTGDVNAEVTIIDPSVDPELMPGNYETLDSNGVMQSIESFGAISVTFADSDGNEYNLGEGQSASIKIPVGSSSSDLPTTIPLYYYDEQTGYWVEEGSATLVTTSDSSYYEGSVSHFTTWNADYIYDSIQINGCVVDSSGVGVSSVTVTTQGVDYSGQSSTLTDQEGAFSVSARPDSSVLLSVVSTLGASRTYTINTDEVDQTLDECISLSSSSTSASVTLTWGDNPRDLDTQFFGPDSAEGDSQFLLYYRNKEETLASSTMWLDVDDTSSYGPEVTTIDSFPYAGRYSYAVYHYSGSSDIAASPARVKLVMGDSTQIFSPPAGDASVCWAVFDFVVDSLGNVTVEEVGTWQDRDYCYASSDSSSTRSLSTHSVTSDSLNKSNLLKQMIEQKYYAN